MSLLFREMESEELGCLDRLEFIDWPRECFSHYLAHIENENAFVFTDSLPHALLVVPANRTSSYWDPLGRLGR